MNGGQPTPLGWSIGGVDVKFAFIKSIEDYKDFVQNIGILKSSVGVSFFHQFGYKECHYWKLHHKDHHDTSPVRDRH